MIKENNQGILVVVSGPSGCGKSSIDQLLIKTRKNITMSISDTTRKIRGEEKDGIDYNFISKEKFLENIENDKYLEYAPVHSHYYGTQKKNIDNGAQLSSHIISDTDSNKPYCFVFIDNKPYGIGEKGDKFKFLTRF